MLKSSAPVVVQPFQESSFRAKLGSARNRALLIKRALPVTYSSLERASSQYSKLVVKVGRNPTFSSRKRYDRVPSRSDKSDKSLDHLVPRSSHYPPSGLSDHVPASLQPKVYTFPVDKRSAGAGTSHFAAGRNLPASPQELDIEHLKLDFQEKEVHAVRLKQYEYAQRLQKAVADVETLQGTFRFLEMQEAAAVSARDYKTAENMKKQLDRSFSVFEAIKNNDYTSDEYVDPFEVCDFANASKGLVAVRIRVCYEVDFGQSLHVLGDIPQLGEWNVESCRQMQWTEGHNWVLHLNIERGSTFEFKFLIKSPPENEGGEEHIRWQDDPNRSVTLPESFLRSADVIGTWDRDEENEVVWTCQGLNSGDMPGEVGPVN